MEFDYVVVGAGFAGSVIAERLANRDKKVLLIERENHIGGQMYDEYDSNGVLIQKYGPHIFHTDNREVFHYLSYFTDWIPYQHKVIAEIDGWLINLPFNLNTCRDVFHYPDYRPNLLNKYQLGDIVRLADLKKHKCFRVISDFIYEKIIKNYSEKQWGKHFKDLDDSVFDRVPIRISTDDRYFTDKYQGIPAGGYTRMFKKMLSNKNIKIMLNTDVSDVVTLNSNRSISLFGQCFLGKIIYTGSIDALDNYDAGVIPYRSLLFDFETHRVDSYQPNSVVNYPNNYDYTRITEFKKLTGQQVEGITVTAKEYPVEGDGKNGMYYPIMTHDAKLRYKFYRDSLDSKYGNKIVYVGRAAEYKYYDMDDVVERALKVYEEING